MSNKPVTVLTRHRHKYLNFKKHEAHNQRMQDSKENISRHRRIVILKKYFIYTSITIKIWKNNPSPQIRIILSTFFVTYFWHSLYSGWICPTWKSCKTSFLLQYSVFHWCSSLLGLREGFLSFLIFKRKLFPDIFYVFPCPSSSDYWRKVKSEREKTETRRTPSLNRYIYCNGFHNALPGNSSVNTAQHATLEEAIFSVDPSDAPLDWLDSDHVMCLL
jgi:hypothetical protein